MKTLSAIVKLRKAIEDQLRTVPDRDAFGDSNTDEKVWMGELVADLLKLEADPTSAVGAEVASWYDGKDSFGLQDYLP